MAEVHAVRYSHHMRTIAFYDVIGIKDAFERGDAATMLTDFWNAVDAWTNADVASTPLLIPGTNSMQSPSLRVRTFSDSAVLMMQPEPSIEDFFDIALKLKSSIEKLGIKSYVVVARGDLVDAPELPALGGHLINSDMSRAYENIVGSGAAWVNAYLADKCIGKTTAWHGKHSVYAVDGAVPRTKKSLATCDFKGHGGQVLKVHALG